MEDDDLPPLPGQAPPSKPTFWQRFLGPENAAGLGGWAGVFGPIGVWFLVTALSGPPARRPGLQTELLYGLICAASGALILGVMAGGIGGRAVNFVERRRGVSWPPWRSQFLAGFAAGALAMIGLAAVGATLASGW